MKKRNTMAGLLAVMLLTSAFASCAEEAPAAGTETDAQSKEVTEAETEASELLYSNQLTPVDYNGAAFKIQTSNNVNGMDYNILHNYADA